MLGLAKLCIPISSVSFAKSAKYLNHVICNASMHGRLAAAAPKC